MMSAVDRQTMVENTMLRVVFSLVPEPNAKYML